MRMELVYVNHAPKTAHIPRAVLRRLALRTQKEFSSRRPSGVVGVAFVSPARMKLLNSTYRSADRATNVLSFASAEAGELGDIVICPSVARKEARALAVPVSYWYGRLFVHGLLHLLGLHHRTARAQKKMERHEAAILEQGGWKV